MFAFLLRPIKKKTKSKVSFDDFIVVRMLKEGFTVELSTWSYLDTVLLKFSENINIQYKNDWYTIQNLTKPVFAFIHKENIDSSSINPTSRTLSNHELGKTSKK